MAGPIAVTVTPAPLITDFADGTAGFNVLASSVEANLTKVNSYAEYVEKAVASQPALVGYSVATPASGWSFDTATERGTYGRKWGPFTFVTFSFLRTGATIEYAVAGNVKDTLVCTLTSAFKPPRIQYYCAAFHSYAPCQIYASSSSGGIYLTSMSQEYQSFPKDRYLTGCLFWINNDSFYP